MKFEITPERFALGMTFAQYVAFTGSAENLGREGFDIRRFGHVRPRIDWSGYLRERHAKAQLTDAQTAACPTVHPGRSAPRALGFRIVAR